MINVNKVVAWTLNFIIAMIILSLALYLLEVPHVDSFSQFCQHILGIILVYFAMGVDLFKGGE